MQPIRYYEHEIDPSVFENRGWRGRLVLVLARLIQWLQRKLEWHAMRVLSEDMSPAQQVELQQAFHQEDVNAGAHKLLRELLHPEPTRQDRYKSLEPTNPSHRDRRAGRSLASFAAYIAPGRSKRYGRARGARIANPEGDVTEYIPAAHYRGEQDAD